MLYYIYIYLMAKEWPQMSLSSILIFDPRLWNIHDVFISHIAPSVVINMCCEKHVQVEFLQQTSCMTYFAFECLADINLACHKFCVVTKSISKCLNIVVCIIWYRMNQTYSRLQNSFYTLFNITIGIKNHVWRFTFNVAIIYMIAHLNI